jgi:hypothetical protein
MYGSVGARAYLLSTRMTADIYSLSFAVSFFCAQLTTTSMFQSGPILKEVMGFGTSFPRTWRENHIRGRNRTGIAWLVIRHGRMFCIGEVCVTVPARRGRFLASRASVV